MGPQRKRLLLSKNLLEMKFMKRTKEKTEKELEDEDRKTTFADQITPAMISHGSKFVIENSYAVCENLTFGRMSFKGANPEIEKLMRKLEGASAPSAVDPVLLTEKDADIRAEEMAGLNHSISRKFSKHQKVRHRGFKRPAED